VSSASSTRLREDDDVPGCLPGLRPDLAREERFLAGFFDHGASEDGGREEFDESAEDRRLNSAISSACSATICSSSTTRAVNVPTSCCSSPRPGAEDDRGSRTSHHDLDLRRAIKPPRRHEPNKLKKLEDHAHPRPHPATLARHRRASHPTNTTAPSPHTRRATSTQWPHTAPPRLSPTLAE
jgi:hypothetical protein